MNLLYMKNNVKANLKPLGVLVMAGCLMACHPSPSIRTQHHSSLAVESSHFSAMADTQEMSGYYIVGAGEDALSVRSALIESAKHSIKMQYYIWHDDMTGRFMLKKLWQKAEQGVQVQVLLDDFNSTPSLDKQLKALASHPNITLKIVNPKPFRKQQIINYVLTPKQINRRMHNKSLTIDDNLSLIGGRNIGNEYLNRDRYNNFADIDVLLTGAVVSKIRQSFEQYWHSMMAYDIDVLVSDEELNDSKSWQFLTNTFDHQYSPMATAVLGRSLPFRWARIDFVVDDVKKLSKPTKTTQLLLKQTTKKIGKPTKHLSIISSYFVPTKAGVEYLVGLAQNGVSVSILTNSLHSTDVAITHAGYEKWRYKLVQAGVRLYELKADACTQNQCQNSNPTFSLHAKMFAADNTVFIGSYNIDPRSAHLNTELGVVIQDERLARQLHQALNTTSVDMEKRILYQAYEIKLDESGELYWQTMQGGALVRYYQEPNVALPKALGIAFFGLLPIDGWL